MLTALPGFKTVPDAHEPLDAEWTGEMSTFISRDGGTRYTFTAPLPRIVAGRHYLVIYNKVTKKIRMLTVDTRHPVGSRA